MLRALIFDVDGTLADTENLGHRRAFNEAFKEQGFDDEWSEQQYHSLLKVAGGKERLKHYWQSIGRPEAEDTSLIDRLHQCKTKIYARLVQAGEIKLRPGVESVLAAARDRGLTLAIATTTTRSNVETLLRARLGPNALDWFQVIACAEDAPNKKPAPDVYQLVLEKLKLPGGDVIVFEDNFNGLQAATAAGIDRVVITPTSFSQSEDFGDTWLVLEDLTQFELGDYCNL